MSSWKRNENQCVVLAQLHALVKQRSCKYCRPIHISSMSLCTPSVGFSEIPLNVAFVILYSIHVGANVNIKADPEMA